MVRFITSSTMYCDIIEYTIWMISILFVITLNVGKFYE